VDHIWCAKPTASWVFPVPPAASAAMPAGVGPPPGSPPGGGTSRIVSPGRNPSASRNPVSWRELKPTASGGTGPDRTGAVVGCAAMALSLPPREATSGASY
jgi:hypothetical protein